MSTESTVSVPVFPAALPVLYNLPISCPPSCCCQGGIGLSIRKNKKNQLCHEDRGKFQSCPTCREKKRSHKRTNKLRKEAKIPQSTPAGSTPAPADVPAPAIAKRQRVSPPCNQLQQLALSQAQKIGQLEQILEQKDAELLQLRASKSVVALLEYHYFDLSLILS